MNLINLALVLSILAPSASMARDYGVHEDVFEIVEEDARISMIKSAHRADWNSVTEEMRGKAIRLADGLPKWDLPFSNEERVSFRKSGAVATRDIDAPLFVDGEIKWVTIVPKGTESIPVIQQKNPMIFAFFNGESSHQVDLIKNLLNKKKQPVIPILINGDPISVSDELERHVYYATDELIKTFGIEFTLTFAYESQHNDKLFFKTHSFPVQSTYESISAALP